MKIKVKHIKSSIPLLLLPCAMLAFAGPTNNPPELIKKGDDYSHPLGKKQRAIKQQALEAKLSGKTKGKVHQVAKGQFVELEREGEELIWTVLGEFSDFSHNSIAEPSSDNNSTIWTADFSQQHYQDLLFSEAPGATSMRNFYIELSSNRYTVDGDVTDWVQVPGTAASYDDDAGALALWSFLEDSVNGWYQSQIDQGKTQAEISAYLSKFDVWDRYDYDGDGNFNEPDGYIDHFQSVHSGEGEEAGGGALGGTAIWSHRWYARYHLIESEGPNFNKLGGIRIGNTDLWIGDYTIEPENGGAGVFSHEYAHDLGLPDLYATAGGSNSTGFWTLMSSGSWLSESDDIGSKPGHMGAWEKLQLGWLNYEVAFAGQKSQHKLGPATANTKQAQGLIVILPDKEVETNIGAPYEGDYMYYSGSGNNLNNIMYKPMTLPVNALLTAKVNADIEYAWDYAYLVVSTDGGVNWENIATNFSTNDNPNGNNEGNGITGSSAGAWLNLEADLSAYAGDVMLGFRYWTDGAVIGQGLKVDNIMITGMDVDGAEMDAGWAFTGFSTSTGLDIGYFFNAYIAENRNYRGYDNVLKVGPYNFGFLDEFGDKVEKYPYQDGLLISYWDTSQTDNNTPQHPGAGLILPIDAHPEVFYRPSGTPWYNRLLSFDSTFSLAPTDELNLHWFSVESMIPSRPGVNKFNDNYQYWNPETPSAGVMNPQTGTEIWIKSISTQGNFMQVQVGPAQ